MPTALRAMGIAPADTGLDACPCQRRRRLALHRRSRPCRKREAHPPRDLAAGVQRRSGPLRGLAALGRYPCLSMALIGAVGPLLRALRELPYRTEAQRPTLLRSVDHWSST